MNYFKFVLSHKNEIKNNKNTQNPKRMKCKQFHIALEYLHKCDFDICNSNRNFHSTKTCSNSI